MKLVNFGTKIYPKYCNMCFTNFNPDKISVKTKFDKKFNIMRVDIRLKKVKK